MNPLDFTPSDFNAYLAEMYPDGGGNAGFLRQQYREKNNVTNILPDGGVADGRQPVAGGFASKDAGATGRDAMRSLRPAIWNGIRGLLQGGGEAAQAPLDAYRGLLSPDEMTGAAMGTAGMAMGGGMAASGRGLLDYDPNTTNIFAGRNAKTADQGAADRAEIMLANGADRGDVWRETGWMRGVDGQMRFEIDDSRSVMRTGVAGLLNNGELGQNIRTDLNGAMLHQDLLGGSRGGQEIPAAYADLGDGFVNATRSDGIYGSYQSKTGDIEIGSPNNIDGRSVLLHEAQHAVQGREGFARGSSPEREESAIYEARNDRSRELTRQMDRIKSEEGLYGYGATHPRLTPIREELDAILGIIPDVKKTAYNNYNNSAGEVEARNTSLRGAMSAERRLETPPWQTQDVPDADQTVDLGGDTMYSTPPEGMVMGGVKPSVAETRRLANIERFGYDPNLAETSPSVTPSGLLSDYVGEHQAPMRDGNAPAFELNGDIYPDDIYSPKAVQYYGTGNAPMDKQSMGLLQSLRGKPDADVTIYRSVPKGVDSLNAGDWVTVNKQYAVDHGEGALNGNYEIVEKKVKASEIFTNGDSIHEFGYDPSKAMPTPRTDAEAMAKQVLEMRAAGNAGNVTDDMMALADDPYMFDNTPELDMSAEGRKGRAGDIDTSLPLYHGGPRDFSDFRPSARGKIGPGVYLTPDVKKANRFSGYEYGPTERIEKMLNEDNLKNSQVYPVFATNAPAPMDVRMQARTERSAYDDNIDAYRKVFDEGGYDGVRVEDERTILNPANIRSIFARNDPAFKHLRNLSAGVAGVGLLSQADQRQQRRGLLE